MAYQLRYVIDKIKGKWDTDYGKRTSNVIHSITVKGVHIGKYYAYKNIWLREECIHAFKID